MFRLTSTKRTASARKLLVERLESRRVFAIALVAQQDLSTSLSETMPVAKQLEIVREHIEFHSQDATAVDLSGDGSALFFDYGKQLITLPAALTGGLVAPEVLVKGDEIFSATPTYRDGSVAFRLSGKPGVMGEASIEVHDHGQLKFVASVMLENAAQETADASPSSLSMEDWDMVGEGESPALPPGGVVGSYGSYVGSYGGSYGSATLQINSTGDSTADEPHLIYAPDPSDMSASFKIDRTNWYGGYVALKLDGAAKYLIDYSLDLGYSAGIGLGWDSATKSLSFYLPSGNTPYQIYVHALQDNAEPGLKDIQGDVDAASEAIAISWYQPQSFQTGSANLNVLDTAEGVALSTEPSTTSELGTDPAKYHLKPAASGYTFKPGVTIHWEIQVPDAANESDLATLGSDYTVQDEAPFLTFGLPTPEQVVVSNPRPVGGDNDFELTVTAIDDFELEGTENVKTRVFVPALVPAGDPSNVSLARTSFETVTITEDYLDARTEKDEKAGCSCSCTTCADGNSVTLSYEDGVATVTTADGMVMVTTAGQDGVKPVTYVGLPLPSGKAVPTAITAQIQVVEKRTDAQGQSIGLGRKLVANSPVVSPTVTFQVPATALPGSTVWFSLQSNLTQHVEAWTRNIGQSSSGNGINAKIIPLELLVDPTFSTTVVDANQKFSGWVGRTSHVVRSESSSGLAPNIGGNASVVGVDRMIRNTEVMLPNAPQGGGSTGGKVKYESGSMLVRASGGVSWFKDSAGQSPESQDTLAGDLLTDRYGNKKRFNSVGDMTEYQDAAGNLTTYSYVASGSNTGAVQSITDDRGQQTTFTYNANMTGVKITTTNSADPKANRSRDLIWSPIVTGGTLKVTYDDPDDTATTIGPRLARQDVFVYNNSGQLIEVNTGAINAPSHRTSISYSSVNSRVATITYPDLSRTTLDLFRQSNGLVDSQYNLGPIWSTDPRALRVDTIGTGNVMPNYSSVTHYRVGSADPQRTIMQLDHRGRVIRSWDPEQVFLMGLASVAIDQNHFPTLQANVARSYEYTRSPVTRDAYGRITGQDYGEVSILTTPQQYAGGPRQTTTWTYTNNNPLTQKLPIQRQESFSWNDTFDVLTEAVDATGNRFKQAVDGSGRVTQQLWERQVQMKWQNPVRPVDVDNDGALSSIDALLVINLLNGGGGGPVSNLPGNPAPYYDVSGDDFISSIDALLVINALNTSTFGPAPLSFVGSAQVDYAYSNPAGIPTDLVSQVTIKTGRSSGDQVQTYTYYNVPTDKARHAKLYRITEADGSYTEFNYDARGNLSSVRDPAGRVTKMWYDNRDRLIARMSPDPDGAGQLLPVLQRFDYDVFDNLIATELVNSWIDAGGIMRVTGLKTSYAYDAANRITSEMTQKPSLQWYFTSGMASQTSTAPLSSQIISVAQLEAYAAGNAPITNTPAASTSNRGKVTTYNYFGTANKVTVTETNAGLDPRVSTVTLDRLDRIVKSVTPSPGTGYLGFTGAQTEAGGLVTTYEYDYLSNLTKTKDSLGRDTLYNYDLLNRITSITEPGGTTGATYQTSFSYTETLDGWNVAVTNPAGEVVATQLDQFGRVTKVSGNTPTVNAAYWLDGQTKSTTDELGRVTDFNYDNRGRLTSAVAPPPVAGGSRSTTSYFYNVGNDNLVDSISDPLGRSTVFTYDDGGRLSLLTEPDPDGAGVDLSAQTQYVRDSLGNVLKTSDRFNQSQTVTARDAWFRTLSTTDPGGALTSFQYDVFGNTTKVTDPLNNVTDYTYNKLNQLVTATQVGYGSRSYLYDAMGVLRRQTDRNGRTTNWGYDTRDRVINETWTGVGGGISYAYDAADRLTSITDTRAFGPDYTFTYDARGQLQNELQNHELMNSRVAFDRDYDAVGLRTKLAANIGATLPGGVITGGVWDFSNTYSYDGMNRLASITQSGVAGGNAVAPKLASFSYDAASQLRDMRRYSSTTASTASLEVHSRMGYDLAGRLTSITHGKTEIAGAETWNGTSAVPASLGASNMLAGYFLTYDQDNRVTSFSSWRDAFKTTYTYDGLLNGTGTNSKDQLATASSQVIAGMTLPFAPANESYNLDANGNRNTSSGTSQSALGTHNRLQSDGTFTYTYDNEGNTTRRTRIVGGQYTEYVWDHRNRLTSVIERTSAGTKTQQVDYIYDAFDQLTGKRFATQFNATTGAVTNWSRYEVFVWADGQEALRFVDSDGQVTAQPARLANRYLWSTAVDQLLADEQYAVGSGPAANSVTPSAAQGNTLWALTDHLGSVRDLVDNNGVIREHNVYDSFGRLVREVDYNTAGTAIASTDPTAVDTLFGYTGRMLDQHTGLQYNRARWYDTNTGRWLSQDPIGFGAGDANLYRYVGNRPSTHRDPSGFVEEWWRDSGWDYVNPFAYSAWVGNGIGHGLSGLWYWRSEYQMEEQLVHLERDYLAKNPLTAQVQEPGSPHHLRESQFATTTFLAETAVNWTASGGEFVCPSSVAGSRVTSTRGTQTATKRSSAGVFTNRARWSAPRAGSLQDKVWRAQAADLSKSFNGKWQRLPNVDPPVGPNGEPYYGTYNPATNTITLYKGADDVTEFEELLHWQDVQNAIDGSKTSTNPQAKTMTEAKWRDFFAKMKPDAFKKMYDAREAKVQKEMCSYGFTRNNP